MTNVISSETTGFGTSYYVDINLDPGSGATPMTGIYFPSAFKPRAEVDVILYLRGNTAAAPPIDRYWKNPPFNLRESLQLSGKNAVLVAPTLGPHAESGTLATDPGRYLKDVVAATTFHKPQAEVGASPRLGKLVVAAHSGGGRALRAVALTMADPSCKYAGNVVECWGFDCLYGTGTPRPLTKSEEASRALDKSRRRDDQNPAPAEGLLADWAKSFQGVRFLLFWTDAGGTGIRSRNLEKMSKWFSTPMLKVEQSKTPVHDEVPKAYFEELTRGCDSLQNV